MSNARIRPSPDTDTHSFATPLTLVVLSLIFGITAFGTDMYLLALPAIARALDISPQSAQLTLSVFLYGNAAGQLVFGPLSDRFGRRPVLLGGLSAYVISSIGCALATCLGAL